MPFLTAAGGSLMLLGSGGHNLIGPKDERWDLVMAVRQVSVQSFLEFASHPAYLGGLCHRTAAVEDARLLPLVEQATPR